MSGKKKRDIPRFQTPIIETHCHLDYLDEDTLDATLAKSAEVGIDTIITIAVSPGNLDKVIRLTRHADNIWGTQGIHPHEADAFDAAVAERIRVQSADPRIVAIGEIGLDYYYDHAQRGAQRTAFEQQLQLAAELDMPVVIHTRDADEDTRSILANFSNSLGRKGVIHSFTSGLPLAEYCLGEGFCLGFNGIATFKAADNVREVVAATPLAQLVIETDSPYLTPVPYRGTQNAPYFLPFVAEYLAGLRGMEVEAFLAAVYANSERLFWGEGATGEAA